MRCAVYTRVSDEDGRSGPSFGSPEEQEAACRGWIEHEAGAVLIEDGVVYDGNISGAKPADERELGRLIRMVETGDLDVIVVRYIDRFGRNMIENATSLKRIEAAGGRLVAPGSGFDSKALTAQSRMTYNILGAIAEAQREVNIESRLTGIRRASERGVYLAGSAPAGYDRKDGVLSIQPKARKLVREVHARRANGESRASIMRWLHEDGADVETVDEWAPSTKHPEGRRRVRKPFAAITEQGVSSIFKNRAYLGENAIQKPGGGTEVVKGGAWRILTEVEFEATQAKGGGPQHRKSGRWAALAALRGLVYCADGHRMWVGSCRARPNGEFVAELKCNRPECGSRVAIQTQVLDEWALARVQQAVVEGHPGVVGVLSGDDRYARAVEAVEAAREELDTYREAVKITDVGKDAWLRDVASRKAVLDDARAALREVPRATAAYSAPLPVTAEEWAEMPEVERRQVVEAAMNADVARRVISKITVKPVGRGRRVPMDKRCVIEFVGA